MPVHSIPSALNKNLWIILALLLPVRRYARVVSAVAWCPSVRHRSGVLLEWMNRRSRFFALRLLFSENSFIWRPKCLVTLLNV